MITLKEQYLYGSKRLGVRKPNVQLAAVPHTVAGYQTPNEPQAPGGWFNNDCMCYTYEEPVAVGSTPPPPANTTFTARFYTHTLGIKEYELTNHLGNVLATVLDRKTGVKASPTATTYAYFKADVTTAQDYYPFGSLMPGRTYVAPANAAYRFGFNGQQRDDEIAGSGNHNTALFWEYDTRIVSRWNPDPVKVAWESPYVINRNNPIVLNDPDGDCSTCPPPSVNGNISARINIGGTSGASGSLGFGLGVSSQTGSNFSLGTGFSGSVNFGGLGSSSYTPGVRIDVAATITGTLGAGTDGSQSLQTINSQMPSGIMNTFGRSGTIGANFIFGTDNRNQVTGYLGFRSGNVSIGHSNDFFFGMSDHYWGAETNLKLGSENGPNLAVWNEVYNGKRTTSGSSPTANIKANYQRKSWFAGTYDVMLVKQNARDISLNSGRTQVIMNMPISSGGTLSLGIGGEGGLHMGPQRWLHYGKKYPQFEHDVKATRAFITSGYSAF